MSHYIVQVKYELTMYPQVTSKSCDLPASFLSVGIIGLCHQAWQNKKAVLKDNWIMLADIYI